MIKTKASDLQPILFQIVIIVTLVGQITSLAFALNAMQIY